MKVVINRCFGGFGLSEKAYEWLIARGVPVRAYVAQKRGPDGRYMPQPENDGEVIFDRELGSGGDPFNASMRCLAGRYWDVFLDGQRSLPLLVACVEALGAEANGPHAELAVVEIPDGIEYEIDEYAGNESIHERHRSWK